MEISPSLLAFYRTRKPSHLLSTITWVWSIGKNRFSDFFNILLAPFWNKCSLRQSLLVCIHELHISSLQRKNIWKKAVSGELTRERQKKSRGMAQKEGNENGGSAGASVWPHMAGKTRKGKGRCATVASFCVIKWLTIITLQDPTSRSGKEVLLHSWLGWLTCVLLTPGLWIHLLTYLGSGGTVLPLSCETVTGITAKPLKHLLGIGRPGAMK